MPEIVVDFYGVSCRVSGPAPIIDLLALDFSYFVSKGVERESFELTINSARPPFENIPELKGSLYQPDSISFDKGDTRYVDYHGKALSVYDYKKEKAELYSNDLPLLHELSYLLILSRSGEMLDKRGIHRVHACAFSINGKGVICLMPQGAGKTTLYLELIKNEKVKLISDDTPLLDNGLNILPFPLRIGVDEGTVLDVPSQYLGSMERRRFGKKLLIDTKYYEKRISQAVRADYLFIGERKRFSGTGIAKVGKITAMKFLFRDCVAGLGLPQMVEYFLRYGFGNVISKSLIILSRVFVCLRVVMTARTFGLELGTDSWKNAEALIKVVEES